MNTTHFWQIIAIQFNSIPSLRNSVSKSKLSATQTFPSCGEKEIERVYSKHTAWRITAPQNTRAVFLWKCEYKCIWLKEWIGRTQLLFLLRLSWKVVRRGKLNCSVSMGALYSTTHKRRRRRQSCKDSTRSAALYRHHNSKRS